MSNLRERHGLLLKKITFDEVFAAAVFISPTMDSARDNGCIKFVFFTVDCSIIPPSMLLLPIFTVTPCKCEEVTLSSDQTDLQPVFLLYRKKKTSKSGLPFG